MPTAPQSRPGRNEPCYCGSGRKYKQCCLEKDEAKDRAARAKAAATTDEAPPAAEGRTPAAPPPPRRQQTFQPWKKGATQTRGLQRMSTPRKVGGS